MFKNVATKLTVIAFADAGHATLDAGEVVTGDAAQITCKVEQDDDGSQDATNDVNPTEIEDGQYVFDLLQAETNGDKLTFYPQSSTAGVQVVALPSLVIYTRPPNFPSMGIETDGDVHADVKQWLGTAAATPTTAGVPSVAAIAGEAAFFQDFFTVDSGEVSGAEVSGSALLEAAKIVWDRRLTGATHGIATSAGKRLRQIDAAFEVHSGTARVTSTSTTIDLELATADNVTDEIYAGDRCVIVAGTGIGEHGLILSYNSTTQVATMSKAWIITPDATSEYILTPADVDVELWNDNSVTGDGDWAELQTDIDAILVHTNELQAVLSAGILARSNNATLESLLGVDDDASEDTLVFQVWEEVITKARHNLANSAAKILRQSGDISQIDGAVSDASPTTTGFDTDLTQVDGFFEDALMVFNNGAANAGIGQPITGYLQVNGAVTFDTPDDWPVTPVNGDDFTIYGIHIHPVTQIADALLDRADGIEPASAGTERTVRETLRIVLSACGGKGAGLGGTTATYRDTNDTKDRITATVDADGNRSAVTLDDT